MYERRIYESDMFLSPVCIKVIPYISCACKTGMSKSASDETRIYECARPVCVHRLECSGLFIYASFEGSLGDE